MKLLSFSEAREKGYEYCKSQLELTGLKMNDYSCLGYETSLNKIYCIVGGNPTSEPVVIQGNSKTESYPYYVSCYVDTETGDIEKVKQKGF